MTIYIRNNHTGKKYYLNSISRLLISLCIPLSLLLYGLGVALLFDLLGFRSDIVILVMVIAYGIEILLEILNKFTIVKTIFGCLLFIVLCPIWIDIARSENINFFKNTIRKLQQVVDYIAYLYSGIGSQKRRNIDDAVIPTKQ